jgi:membrane-bound lytic murein transglycosylase B
VNGLNVEKNEAEKKELLKISKTQEKTYEQVLKERQKKASQIRAALFALRDTAAIPFGTALAYANVVSAKTGVRPAFLLAILTQETNLGENIGTCNRPGDPASKLWTAIMPGPSDLASGKSKRNDQAAFLRITSGLGLDPASVPLSCPWQGGWGGAMGPAQFIPTTWESKQSSIAAALGKSKVSPWEPQDAFMASGLYLSELGANSGTFTAERTAALKYYAGGAWNAKKNAFYGDGVMAKARNIQENMIDPLQNV